MKDNLHVKEEDNSVQVHHNINWRLIEEPIEIEPGVSINTELDKAASDEVYGRFEEVLQGIFPTFYEEKFKDNSHYQNITRKAADRYVEVIKRSPASNNSLKAINNIIDAWFISIFISETIQRDFDGFISRPPMYLMSTPKLIKDIAIKKLMGDNTIILETDDESFIRRPDMEYLEVTDTNKTEYNEAELRKKIKYAKSYQERRYYQQLLGDRCSKKHRKKKK